MSNVSIYVENLSKQYSIAAGKSLQNNLVDQLTIGFMNLFQRSEDPDPDKDSFWALKDVSFEIKAGDIVGIIGNNGAGKSTLLKILSRITVPTLGRAEVYGRVGSLLEVGTGFHPELTGRENIFLNGAIIGMKKDEIRRRFDEIVAFAEIEKFLDVPVKRYSSGMYVRLGFSVAAHLEPEILLVDEVLSVGDSAFQKKCLDKIRNASLEGRTVFFISHSMTAVNSLCKRVIWLKGGQIVEDGSSTEVVTKYLATSLKGLDLTEEVWKDMNEAPGNEMVRLHRICVRRQDGQQSDPLTMQSPFRIEIEFWNLIAEANLHITVHLYTADGIIAFATGSQNDGPIPAGLFRTVGYIPGNLMNSGIHRFVVLFIKDSSCLIHRHESGVPINILDISKRDGTCYGKEPGVVQPMLKWTTEYLDMTPEIGNMKMNNHYTSDRDACVC